MTVFSQQNNQSSTVNAANALQALFVIGGVAITYGAFAAFGLIFAIEGNVSAVWFPSGVALAAVLIFGRLAGVGVMLASFVSNFVSFSSQTSLNQPALGLVFIVSAAIALGAASQAFFGAYLLKRFAKQWTAPFDSSADVLVFVILSAVASCMLNATVGATAVTLGGFAKPELYGTSWLTWWLGDAIGVILMAPILLVWRKPPALSPTRVLEALGLTVVLAIVGYIVARSGLAFWYALMPLVIIAAFRFGTHGVSLAVLFVSLVSIASAAQGFSVFARSSINETLLLLQSYMSVISLTGLLIGAVLRERTVAQQELVAVNRELEQRVIERTQLFKEAKEVAEKANKAKSTFLTNISHDLRNPLNAIIGYTDLQLVGITGDLNPEQRDYQTRVMRNAQDLLDLINSLLDVARIEAGRIEIAQQDINLSTLLSEIRNQNAILAERKGLKFSASYDEQLPTLILGDRIRLKQVITNLLSNAIKFTEAGSVELIFRCLGTLQWQIEVRDSGVGIPPEVQTIIFDDYFQVDGVYQRQQEGAGLGLAITRRLVEMMDGTIRVQSQIGQGAVFLVTMPLNIVESNKETP